MNDKLLNPKQSLTHQHSAKNIVLTVLKIMGLPPESRIVPLGTRSYLSGQDTKHFEPANEFIYSRLVRKDNSTRKFCQKCWIAPQNFKSCVTISVKLVSSYSLMTCHCAECDTGRNWKAELPAIQSNLILRSTVPKTLFWIAVQTWDGHVRILSLQTT